MPSKFFDGDTGSLKGADQRASCRRVVIGESGHNEEVDSKLRWDRSQVPSTKIDRPLSASGVHAHRSSNSTPRTYITGGTFTTHTD